MWCPPRRPYQTPARPRLIIPFSTQRNKQRDALRPDHDPFSRPPPKPTTIPVSPFNFHSPPTPRPTPHRVDPVPPPPPLESHPRNPRFVHRAPQPPKSPHPLTPELSDPSCGMPGAFPTPRLAEHADNFGADPTPDPAPDHTNAQAKQEGETNQRKRRRGRDDCDIGRLRKSVRREFADDVLGEEETMLLKQLRALHIDHTYRTRLFEYRQTMKRAARHDEERAQKQAQRDETVERIVRMEEKAKEKEREKERAEDERRRRIQEQLERYREGAQRRARELREARRRQEAEALKREQLRLAEEQARQQERDRKEREAREREEAEIRARVAAERRRCAQERIREQIRTAREGFSAADASSICRQFEEYDAKWVELKDGRPLPLLCFGILPWPILGPTAGGPSDITLQRVKEFVFHPLRSEADIKTRRELVRAEMLKWHPDKFNAKVLHHVMDTHKLLSTEGAGAVARFLTQILEEESTREQ